VVNTYGDATNVRYMMAAAYADYLIYEFAAAMTGDQGPLRLEAQTVGHVTSLNAFEMYVPAPPSSRKRTKAPWFVCVFRT
jgi:hypothetical protein